MTFQENIPGIFVISSVILWSLFFGYCVFFGIIHKRSYYPFTCLMITLSNSAYFSFYVADGQIPFIVWGYRIWFIENILLWLVFLFFPRTDELPLLQKINRMNIIMISIVFFIVCIFVVHFTRLFISTTLENINIICQTSIISNSQKPVCKLTSQSLAGIHKYSLYFVMVIVSFTFLSNAMLRTHYPCQDEKNVRFLTGVLRLLGNLTSAAFTFMILRDDAFLTGMSILFSVIDILYCLCVKLTETKEFEKKQ